MVRKRIEKFDKEVLKREKGKLLRRYNSIHKKYPVDDSIDVVKEVCYKEINKKKLYLDVYTTTEKSKITRPAIIFVHGGAWLVGNKDQFIRQASYFAKNFNFLSVTLNYRLSEEAKFPDPLYDIRAAIKWVRSQAEFYNIDKKKIAICGGSSGAYLALMTLLTEGVKKFGTPLENKYIDSGVNLAILFNGVYDLVEIASNNNLAFFLKLFLGKSVEEDPELYKKASPINILNKNMSPALFLHGKQDDRVPYTQSTRTAKKLKELGVYTEVEIYNDKSHGWYNFEKDYNITLKRVEKFICEQFKL